MAVEKIVTLCKEDDATTQYYPNIKGENIPEKAVAESKLTQELQDKIVNYLKEKDYSNSDEVNKIYELMG